MKTISWKGCRGLMVAIASIVFLLTADRGRSHPLSLCPECPEFNLVSCQIEGVILSFRVTPSERNIFRAECDLILERIGNRNSELDSLNEELATANEMAEEELGECRAEFDELNQDFLALAHYTWDMGGELSQCEFDLGEARARGCRVRTSEGTQEIWLRTNIKQLLPSSKSEQSKGSERSDAKFDQYSFDFNWDAGDLELSITRSDGSTKEYKASKMGPKKKGAGEEK